ncbi:hypothetical protein yfred0001_2690 [Yersinia frederiksenii ATCC 33641]|nr:hypothetical protein yfred0001_2690 [Yersinia frederiksenii ATCC 33641]
MTHCCSTKQQEGKSECQAGIYFDSDKNLFILSMDSVIDML